LKATWCLLARSSYALMFCINLSTISWFIDNGSFEHKWRFRSFVIAHEDPRSQHISAIYHLRADDIVC
jgi:hypothetical protein